MNLSNLPGCLSISNNARQINAVFQKNYDVWRCLFMRKANGSIHMFIKLSLLSYVFLLFLFSNIGENMTYAMNSNLLLTPATIEPTPQSTVEPAPKPTAVPTPQPTTML